MWELALGLRKPCSRVWRKKKYWSGGLGNLSSPLYWLTQRSVFIAVWSLLTYLTCRVSASPESLWCKALRKHLALLGTFKHHEMVNFMCQLARLWCLGVWSNTSLDIATKVLCRCGEHLPSLTLSKGEYLPPVIRVGLIQPTEDLTKEDRGFLGKKEFCLMTAT